MILLWVSVTCGQPVGKADLWSDVPLPLCPHHPYAPTPSKGSSWPRVILLQVGLTVGQPLGQADLWSDVPLPSCPCPQERHLTAKSDVPVGQLDKWSALCWANLYSLHPTHLHPPPTPTPV